MHEFRTAPREQCRLVQAIAAVQKLFRIADDVEWKAPLIWQQLVIRRVKDDHFSDAGIHDFLVPCDERLEMKVADRTPGKTTKLKIVSRASGSGSRRRHHEYSSSAGVETIGLL
jgi:hypothetical protein